MKILEKRVMKFFERVFDTLTQKFRKNQSFKPMVAVCYIVYLWYFFLVSLHFLRKHFSFIRIYLKLFIFSIKRALHPYSIAAIYSSRWGTIRQKMNIHFMLS